MIAIFTNITGLVIIALIAWWFMIKKPLSQKVVHNSIDIQVHDGIYDPAIIEAKAGEKISLNFFRTDKTPCSEIVMFEKLGISDKLPIEKKHTIVISSAAPGEYEFTCQMGMYRGKLIVT